MTMSSLDSKINIKKMFLSSHQREKKRYEELLSRVQKDNYYYTYYEIKILKLNRQIHNLEKEIGRLMEERGIPIFAKISGADYRDNST